MSDPFTIRPLAPDQVAQVFSLVAIFDPELDQAQWSRYAEALVNEHSNGAEHGILTVQNDRRYIYGLSVFWPKLDLRVGRVLEIENFAVVDLSGNLKTAKLLLEGLEEMGQRLACNCITISLLQPLMRRWLRDPDNPALELFRGAGFRGDQMRLRKCF